MVASILSSYLVKALSLIVDRTDRTDQVDQALWLRMLLVERPRADVGETKNLTLKTIRI
jgi:hypothetical protein